MAIRLIENIIVPNLPLDPEDRAELLLYLTSGRDTLERIIELSNDVDYFIVDVVYYLFNNNGVSSDLMLWKRSVNAALA